MPIVGRVGVSPSRMPSRGAAGSAPAWQQILTLAEADGWTAVYDPTNPDTRTLRTSGDDSYVSAIADGLGNMPDLTQATEANQFKLLPGFFGQLDGLEANGTSTTMATTTFTSHAQPNFDMILAKSSSVAAVNRQLLSNGNAIFMRNATNNPFSYYAGSSQSGALGDVAPHVHSALFNGASSALYQDNTATSTANPGANGRTVLRIGAWDDGTQLYWSGEIGVLLHYDGEPTEAVRTRMHDLISSLADIERPETFASEGSASPFYGTETYPAATYIAATETTWLAWEKGVDVAGTMTRRVYVTTYDHATDAISAGVEAGANTLVGDSHGVPAIARDHEGHLHIFYGAHSDPMQHASTDAPDDHSAWTDRTAISGSFTYPKPCAVGSDLYVFMRGAATAALNKLSLVKTASLASGAATWDAAVTLVEVGSSNRIYAGVTVVDGTDIHIIACISGQTGGTGTADAWRAHVYYMIYDTTDGSLRNFAGTTTVAPASFPVNSTDFDSNFRIVDHGSSYGAIPGLCIDSNGRSHILYAEGTSEDGDDFDLKHIMDDGAGGWSAGETIGTTVGRLGAPSAVPLAGGAIDAYYVEDDDGNWSRGGSVVRRRRSANGTWGDSRIILAGRADQAWESICPVANGTGDLRVFMSTVSGENDSAGGEGEVYGYGDAGFVS